MTKQELLKEVWKTCTFDEIIDAGFEQNECGACHLIAAAKEFEDVDYLIYVIENMKLGEVIDALRSEHSLRDIIQELGKDDVMDEIGDDELLEHIEDSFAMDNHDDEIRKCSYNEGFVDGFDEAENRKGDVAQELRSFSGDRLMQFFCDVFGVSYYDNTTLRDKFNKMFAKFENSCYNENNLKWELK